MYQFSVERTVTILNENRVKLIIQLKCYYYRLFSHLFTNIYFKWKPNNNTTVEKAKGTRASEQALVRDQIRKGSEVLLDTHLTAKKKGPKSAEMKSRKQNYGN